MRYTSLIMIGLMLLTGIVGGYFIHTSIKKKEAADAAAGRRPTGVADGNGSKSYGNGGEIIDTANERIERGIR